MAGLYPDSYKLLATGGAIGDSLFFFCSGFLLMNSRGGNFFNWYKRRVNRIFPTIFAVAIFGIVFFGADPTLKNVIISAGGWFVQCIFVFYAIFWFVKNFIPDKIWVAIIIDAIIILVWYVFLWNKEIFILADATYLRWPIFYMSMLFGAFASRKFFNRVENRSVLVYLLLLGGLLVVYYGFQLIESRIQGLDSFQVLLAAVLYAITFIIFRICSHPDIEKIYTTRFIYKPVYWMSALCLEAYLCQTWIFPLGKQLINIFPLNIILSLSLIFVLAYSIKVSSNFLSQTFKEGDYNWKQMLTL